MYLSNLPLNIIKQISMVVKISLYQRSLLSEVKARLPLQAQIILSEDNLHLRRLTSRLLRLFARRA